MLNIQDFIDAGACAEGVLEIVESTGKVELPVAELLKISSECREWTERCFSSHGKYGNYVYNYRYNAGYGDAYGDAYGDSGRCNGGGGDCDGDVYGSLNIRDYTNQGYGEGHSAGYGFGNGYGDQYGYSYTEGLWL